MSYKKIRKEYDIILNTYIPESASTEDGVACAVDIIKAVMKHALLKNSDFKVIFWSDDDKVDKLSYIVKGSDIVSLLQDHKEYSFSFNLAELN